MHALGLILMGAAVQVTVILVVIFVLLRLARNSDPRWRSQIVLWGLFAVLCASALAFCPGLSWGGLLNNASATKEPPTLNPLANSAISQTDQAAENNASKPLPRPGEGPFLSPWQEAWSAFVAELQSPSVQPPPETKNETETKAAKPALTMPAGLAILFLIGAGLGMLRLVAGIVLLRREIRKSPTLQEARIEEILRHILADSQHRFTIEVRVSQKLQSAATTGIFRPVVLLPAGWPSWSDDELRAVLAHELNHIQRRDCITALCSELGRVLHFYHPLMHWLANRLRLEQELAADAVAARHIGGQSRYLRILAEMALSQSSRVPAWPARDFLPSQRTFMRRIEMLKKTSLNESRVSRWRHYGTIALIGLATVFAIGLRQDSPTAEAQETNPKQRTTEQAQPKTAEDVAVGEAFPPTEAFPLTYVPDDAIAVFGVRPSVLLKQSELKPLAKVILENEATAQVFRIPLEEIDNIVWSFGTKDTPRHQPQLIAGMVRTSKDLNLETLKEHLTPKSDTGFYGGQLYLKQDDGREGPAFWLANGTTLIVSDTEAGLKQAINARNASINRQDRIPAWKAVAKESVAGYINVGLLQRIMAGGMRGLPGGADMFSSDLPAGRGGFPGGLPGGAPRQPAMFGLNPMLGPLWSDVDTVVGRLEFDKGLKAEITTNSKDAPSATKVKQTLDAMMVLGRNMIEQNQQMIGLLPEQERQMIGLVLKTSQAVLKTLKVEQNESKITIQADVPQETANALMSALVPGVLSAQDAAYQARSLNNLKQIGLAMHNFHDRNSSFPATTLMGPDGKTPHSWRVAILPFLEEQELYEEYRFDEPWDSEHNKKLIAKMPDIYRHPKDKPGSTNASYFGLVGERTLMGDSQQPTRIRDIVDGTSNTLMIVEAKRDIPWTKPEDIAYAGRSKPVPKLGGWFEQGFTAVFGDGSAHFLSDSLDKDTLHNLIERNDGNAVRLDSGTRPAGGRDHNPFRPFGRLPAGDVPPEVPGPLQKSPSSRK